MDGAAGWLVALDALSGILLAVVAYRFTRLALPRRDPLLLLFAAGIGIIALSYPTVAASEFDLGADPAVWDDLRAAGQTGGALVVLAAYATARLFGRARPALALGWVVVAMTVLACIVFLVPAAGRLPSPGPTLAVAHATMALVWAMAAALAGGRASVAAVPVAFVAFAVGKVAWLAVDLGAGTWVVPVVYAARFTGVALLLHAAGPILRAPGGAHAAA